MTLQTIQEIKPAWGDSWRENAWENLEQPWDLIVIGGGITGAGILREAVRSGLRTLLLEADDFAAGTSSRSSKLVHGGFRYLRNAQIKLTYQAVHERERLLSEGRGLVTPLGCLLASYQNDSIPAWVFWAGLILYDFLALHWGHRRYDRYDMQSLCPDLCEEGLKGGFRFFDAQTDDARLTLRVIQEAVQDGGLALNYTPVIGLLKRGAENSPTSSLRGSPTRPGQVCGVVVCDNSPVGKGRTKEILAPVIVNATGVWADQLRQLLASSQGNQQTNESSPGAVRCQARLRQLRGSHLIFPGSRFPLTRSVNLLHPRDGRPVFAYTWEGVTLVGTTDVDHRSPLVRDPKISTAEVAYLLEFVQAGFPGLEIDSHDIQATFSGIRAVVNTGKADPSRESREHVLWNEAGLLTITGGKLTTFRLMALEALKAVFKAMPRLAGREFSKNHPARQRILEPVQLEPLIGSDLAPKQRLRLAGRYGSLAAALIQGSQPVEFDPIGETQSCLAELRWAARNEAVVHLDDLLLRRLRLGIQLPMGGQAWLDQFRSHIQAELRWDDFTWDAELRRYKQLWQESYSGSV